MFKRRTPAQAKTQVAAQYIGPQVKTNLRGADPRYDYVYGNTVAAYQQNSRPYYVFAEATRMPTPGAMSFGNVTEWLAWRPMIGAAVGVAKQFRTLYNVKPIYQQDSMALTTGLGGVVQGQVALQPLSDPYNNEAY